MSEVGLPPVMIHFASQEYGQRPRNWAITQDDRGIIYVANNDGILEYDGETWRTIRVRMNTLVRSLDVGADGTVYAGTSGDFGYLRADSTGLLRYVSLIDEVPEEHRDFQDVWTTRSSSDGIYFQTRNRLFRWDGTEMRVWESEGLFHTSFSVRGRFFVREYEGRGLLHVVGDSLTTVFDKSQFSEFDEIAIYMMAPYPGGRILVATREGLFVLEGDQVDRLPSHVDEFLADKRLYHGCALSDDRYALATLEAGVVVIDTHGRVAQVVNREAGLPDEVVNYVFYDAQGGLWMALHNRGLFRVDMTMSVSLYDGRLGLDGVIHGVQRHDGILYVATGSGLFRLKRRALEVEVGGQVVRSSFEPVFGVGAPLHLSSTPEGLLVAGASGLFNVTADGTRQISDASTYFVSSYNDERGTVLVGRGDGLSVAYHGGDGWRLRRIVPQVTSATQSITELPDGTLWLGTLNDGVIRAVPTGSSSEYRIERFGPEHGLPEGYVAVRSLGGRPAFAPTEGVYRMHETNDGIAFRRDSTLTTQNDLLALDEDARGNIWMVYRTEVDIVRPDGMGGSERVTPPELYLPEGAFNNLIFTEKDVTWISTSDGLLRYDAHQPRTEPVTFPPLFRGIQSLNTNKLVYGGADPSARMEGTGTAREADVELPFEANALRFAFAAPLFNTTLENEYQWQLDGHDTGWSDWSPETYKTYANLRPGTYRFRVRARNGLHGPSEEAVYAFTVLPPWYLTWWAYVLYAVMAVSLVLGGRHYHRIVQENRRAQEQARELARERLANERLKQANDTLKQANRLKDELLANTSHELRTPLTAILGFTSILREELPEQHHEFLDFIATNGERLLSTVNSLLDLAKIRAGMMEVHLQQVDVMEVTHRVVQLLQPLAQQKSLDLIVEEPDGDVLAYVDERYIEQILQNIVGNAVKFTEDGEVAVVPRKHQGRVEIVVRDTGIGIDPEFVPHVFEDFKQESSGLDRSHEGSGLGLSIAARFAELMNGDIEVESDKGQGSVFTVTLPVYQTESKDWVAA